MIHVLHRGVTLCRMPGLPRDWPLGHKWVRLDEWEQDATCGVCRALASQCDAGGSGEKRSP